MRRHSGARAPEEVVRLLIEAGADVDALDERGRTPVEMMVAQTAIVSAATDKRKKDIAHLCSWTILRLMHSNGSGGAARQGETRGCQILQLNNAP